MIALYRRTISRGKRWRWIWTLSLLSSQVPVSCNQSTHKQKLLGLPSFPSFWHQFRQFIYFHTLCPSVPLSVFEAQSFQFAHVWYSVHVNSKFTEVPACSCYDYGRHQMPCKHMYSVERFHEGMKVSYAGEPANESEDALVDDLAVALDPQEQDDQNMNIIGPYLEAQTGPLLRLHST
ncbi:MAG: hypothetical protein BYD32DRAFT_407218 [Podila humilis]|nr:MAG: hypothetical protein BYD32DRAFT_407218 [Podila humilis]